MASTYEYTISIQDRVSSVMQKITGASTDVIDKLKRLDSTKKILASTTNDLQGSIFNLKQKMDLLQQEKELINPANMQVIKEYNKEIDELKKQIDKFENAGCEKKSSPFSFLNASAMIQQTQAVSEAISGIAATGIGFEQSMADLSSITGIAGDDLASLGKIAKITGKESGLGAKQAADAFAILASQIQVDKIGMEGLEVLQRKTITLSQAAGMSMNDAAIALAGTINQFGLQATEAERVINVLAAGSKYGAAEIVDLSQSFKVVGAAANAAGLSVESTAGAIEVLSKNNLKGAEAGTALRNIVLKMQTALGVDFSKSSLSDALDALKPKMKDATYLSKVFGMENIAAAQFLIANSDAVAEMTAQVTGTNVAQEQAAIRTSTTQAMMARCNATIDNLKIGFFDLTGSFGGYATIVAQSLVPVAQLIPLFTAMGSITKLWGVAQLFLNSAMWTSPITWVIASVVALAAIIYVAWQKFDWFRGVIYASWEAIKGFGALIKDFIIDRIKGMLSGITGLGKALSAFFQGDWKQSWEYAKQGAADLFGVSAVKNAIGNAHKMGEDISGAYSKGVATMDKTVASPIIAPKIVPATIVPDPKSKVNLDFDLTKKGKKGSVNSVDLDNNKIANLKGSTLYSAIASRLAPVKVASLASAAASLAMPMAVAATTLPTNGDMQMQATEQYADGGRKVNIDTINITINNANIKDSKELADMVAIKIQEVLSDEA